MPTQVAKYSVIFYGSPQGYQTNRAQIALFDAGGTVVGYLRFNDPGMYFENDRQTDGKVYMHLPSTMFQSVVDVLRNEDPIYIYYSNNKGFLKTKAEPVGEHDQ